MVKREKNLEHFRHVYVENKDTIFKIVVRYSNVDYDTAQDITQEVFVKLYEHFDTYTEEYLLQWLIVAAKNEAISYLRRVLREVPDEEVDMSCSDVNYYLVQKKRFLIELIWKNGFAEANIFWTDFTKPTNDGMKQCCLFIAEV